MNKRMRISFKGTENIWYIGLTLLLLLSGVIKLICVLKRPGPIIFGDELLYRRQAAEIFYEHTFKEIGYPPMYPLVISVAFLCEEFYFVTQIINIVLSIIGTVAVWKILRLFVDQKNSFWGILLVAILPWQYEYCSKMMSENLYYPLLMWVIYTFLSVLFKDQIKMIDCLGLGILFALLHLTRHITIVLLPVFAIFWFLRFDKEGRWSIALKKEKLITGFLILGSYIMVYGGYIFYRILYGNTWQRVLGLNVSGIGKESIKDYATMQSLMVMIILYASYLFLSVLYLFPSCLLGGCKYLKRNNEQRIAFAGMLFVGISIMLMIAAIRHSWRSAYNYPEISYIIGRYIIYIPVMFIIFWILVKDKVIETEKKWILVVYQILETILLVLAGQILTKGVFWNLREKFLDVVNTRDVYYIYYFYIPVIIMSMIKGAVLLLKDKWYNIVTQLFMTITLLVGSIFILNFEGNEGIGAFGKMINEYNKKYTLSDIEFIIDDVSIGHLESDIEFWTEVTDKPIKAYKILEGEEVEEKNIENYDLEIIASDDDTRCTYENLYDKRGLILFQTSEIYSEGPIFTCDYQKRQYGLYHYPINAEIKISCSYPDKIICKQGFNVQEDGQSALAIQTNLPEGTYDVHINGDYYAETYIGKDGLGSFFVSENTYSKPGELLLEIHFKGNNKYVVEKQQPFVIEIVDDM